MHTLYRMLYSRLSKTAQSTVINYKHEMHAIAYTFKAVSWQI